MNRGQQFFFVPFGVTNRVLFLSKEFPLSADR